MILNINKYIVVMEKNKNNFYNVSKIRDNGICTGCGTCQALCPNEAIVMSIDHDKGIYIPIIHEKCEKCGLCLDVCSGHEVNFKVLNKDIFGGEPVDEVLGNFISGYVGNSADENLRKISSSGGVINQILICALEEGIIDGAIVTRMKKDSPFEPEPFIARTKAEIIEASTAKYCPVPLNISIKEVLESKANEKYAVVGLPCHIHGIRKASQINDLIREKIVLYIGIFCSTGINFLATEYILKIMHIEKEEVEKLIYRKGDFPPGYASFDLNDNETREISHVDFWNQIFSSFTFFSCNRCISCIDQTGELTDISVGSGWFPYNEFGNKNQSTVISRSKKGEEILLKCAKKGALELTQLDNEKINKVKELQNFHGFKKRIGTNYLYTLKKLGYAIPDYNLKLPSKVNLRTYISLIYLYARIYLSSKKYLWSYLYFLRNFKRI